MAAEQHKEPLDQRTYAHWFAILGVLLVLTSLLSLLQEFFFRRPYKGYVRDFRSTASSEIARQLSEAKALYESTRQSPEFKAAEAKLAAAKEAYSGQAVQGQKKAFEDEMMRAASELGNVRKQLQGIRGVYQEAVYRFEAQHEEPAKETVLKLDPDVDSLSKKMIELDARRKEFKNKIAELALPVSKAQEELDAFQSEVVTLERRLAAVGATDDDIKQVFNEQLKLVDRCATCHAGYDVPGLEGLPEAKRHLRTHPKVTDPITGESVDLLKVHDVQKMGCTPCHQGQGYATGSPEQGHGEVHHWLTPLLRKSDKVVPGLNSAACLKCHETASTLAGADVMLKGKKLVKDYGCWGCHKIKGIGEEEDRLGEAQNDLKRLQQSFAKLKTGYETKVEAGKQSFDKGPTRTETDQFNQTRLAVEAAKHRVDELALEVRRIGPNLKAVREKLYPGWLPVWLEYPKKWRPTTRMPNFFPERKPGFYKLESEEDIRKQVTEEVQALSAFVWQNAEGQTPTEPEHVPSKDEIAKGKELFESVGCLACHRSDEKRPVDAGNVYGPELTRIGEKARLSWLAKWIENPKKMMPDARMPSLRLTPEESKLIACYLTTLKQNDPLPAPAWIEDKKLAETGKQLVERYGCFGCHTIKGMEYGKGKVGTELSAHGSKLVEEFDFGLHEHKMQAEGRFTRQGWISQKIDDPRTYDEGRFRKQVDRLKMPKFDFDKDDVAAITTFIMGNTGVEMHPAYKMNPTDRKAAILEGWRLVDKFNCTGCHRINGQGGHVLSVYGEKPEERIFGPPILQREGQKVQSEWLIEFLKVPYQLRPFLKIKMPTFDMSEAEAISLAKFFAALDGEEYPFHYRARSVLSTEETSGAKKIFDTLQCLRCHQAGQEALSPEEAANKAPDLFLANRRLKQDWVIRWLHNPDALQADTRMPNFWQDGKSLVPDVAGGDTPKQIDMLSEFVMHLKEYGVQPTPPSTAPKGGDSFYEDDEEEEESAPKPAEPAKPEEGKAPAGEPAKPAEASPPSAPAENAPAGTGAPAAAEPATAPAAAPTHGTPPAEPAAHPADAAGGQPAPASPGAPAPADGEHGTPPAEPVAHPADAPPVMAPAGPEPAAPSTPAAPATTAP
ncbi:MAG: c-type cytochrome [Candidatus Wallbacteria bacterium]|nr:c-type cytochrome [Candidatus Wallbacteria bacterium]